MTGGKRETRQVQSMLGQTVTQTLETEVLWQSSVSGGALRDLGHGNDESSELYVKPERASSAVLLSS